MNLSYSVVIRTLGTSGEKYEKLLDSIVNQTIKPEQILVVLPEGYDLSIVNGQERILHSNKGMVSQRAFGISCAESDYILVVDDDIAFGPDFVESLYRFGSVHSLDCVLPMEGRENEDQSTTIDLRYPFFKRVRGAITGQLFQSRLESKYLDRITVTAGHKVCISNNVLGNCYLCQTGNFQCFFIKTDIAKAVHLEEELWLEQGTLTQYAAYDDAAFFYKLFLMGGLIAYALETRYTHLDAKTGMMTQSVIQQKRNRYYSIARNRTVFWYRFLLQPSGSFWRRLFVIAGGVYAMVNYTLVSIIVSLRPRHIKCISALFLGYADAFKSIQYLKQTGLCYRR